MKKLFMFFVLITTHVTNYVTATTQFHVPISTYNKAEQNSQSRIVNGFPAQTNQFPYQVAVLGHLGGTAYVICGGSLISPDWVLTSASCTTPYSQFNLRFGSLNAFFGGTSMTSFHAISHEQYNSETSTYNIALVRTPRHVGLSPSINIIQLPRTSQQSQSFVGFRSTISGYGIDQSGVVATNLNWVDMRIIENTECSRVFGVNVVVDHVVCALGYTNPSNQGHCTGDWGGPLTIDEHGTRTLIGVASFTAAGGCDVGFPSGYIRTTHFINWIYDRTNIPIRP